MKKDAVIRKINEGLDSLYAADGDLIKNRANEETIVTHLTGYFKSVFLADGWSVDAGYNRDGKGPKKDQDENLILPDVVIHHRTPERENRFSPENNLVAIEVKGYWNTEDRNKDSQKLLDIRNRYGYQYLFRIELEESAGRLIEVA